MLVCGKQLEKLQADSDADIEEIKALKEKNYFHESAMQEAQAEIERLKCCGNCKHDSDGEERCYKRSKGFSMIHCVWEAKK